MASCKLSYYASSSSSKSRYLKLGSNLHLLEDLWPEILCRLPVKTLLRFRCVSKSWRDLIDDPNFARLNFAASFSNNRHESHLLVVQHAYFGGEECIVRCSKTLKFTGRLCFLQLDLYSRFTSDNILTWSVLCSVDGLFMVKNRKLKENPELMLWNPSMRKTLILPPSPPISEEMENVDFGLGFDPLSKVYKHVRVAVNKKTVQFVAVYTIGKNSWNSIEFRGEGCSNCRGPFHFQHPQRTICVRGVLYILSGEYYLSPLKLLSFDLSNEVFASTKLPVDVDGESHLFCQALATADGECSLVLIDLSPPNGSIWVLESLGADSIKSLSWTQRYTFATMFPEREIFYWRSSSFFYLNRSGAMLLNKLGAVISYDLETHEEKILLKKKLLDKKAVWPFMENLYCFK